MKQRIFIFAAIGAALLSVAVSCNSDTSKPATPELEFVTVDPTEAEMLVGDILELKVSLTPEDATAEEIALTSEDPSVATVNQDGVVTAVAGGQTTVTVEASGLQATCTVKVLNGNKFPDEAGIGDFFLSDGSLLDVGTNADIVSKADVIGIVYSTDVSRMPEAERAVLEEKGVVPHGYVLAAKHVGDIMSSYMWYYDAAEASYSRDEREIGIPYAYVKDDMYASYDLSDADVDGYLYTHLIWDERADDMAAGFYPVFSAVQEFAQTEQTPETTTGWYLPATGQWFDILRNLTGASLQSSDLYDGDYGNFFWLPQIGSIPDLVNAYLEKISDDQKTLFDSVTNQLWTSSQASADQSRVIIFDSASFIHSFWYYKYFYFGARCVLAF